MTLEDLENEFEESKQSELRILRLTAQYVKTDDPSFLEGLNNMISATEAWTPETRLHTLETNHQELLNRGLIDANSGYGEGYDLVKLIDIWKTKGKDAALLWKLAN